MAFTDNSTLYGAVHEDGINRVIQHIMRQRPSLFNYASAEIAANRELWCSNVEHTRDVTIYSNPLFTILPALPLLGADSPLVSVGFSAQLGKAQIDFHGGNTISLPPELAPPLPPQRFALSFSVCAAIACPIQRVVDSIPVPQQPAGAANRPSGPPIVLPGETNCFCFEVFVVGHVERQFILGREALLAKVDAMDIVDIKPQALEDNIICYLKTALNVVLREKLTFAVETLMLSFPLFGMGTVTLAPTPVPKVANNPAIEEDQLKVFVDMTII